MKWDDNSWNLWRKSTEICRKLKSHQYLMKDFHRAGKIKKPACKPLRISTKNEENFENFQENFELFSSKSIWKIDFFTNVSKLSLGVLASFWKYIPLEDNIRFLQQYFRFRGATAECNILLIEIITSCASHVSFPNSFYTYVLLHTQRCFV